MYNIAKNPEKQEKLRKEVQNLPVDGNGLLKPGCFNNAPYLRACFKESMRISPVVPGVSRTSGQDLEIKGYHVPKGVRLLFEISIHSQQKTVSIFFVT